MEHGTQFDTRLLDAFAGLVQGDTLREVAGHSEPGVLMVVCPSCGPVITVCRDARDGDVCYCRICGSKHRLHRDGESFVVEPTGEKGSADALKPRPETSALNTFISEAPDWVDI